MIVYQSVPDEPELLHSKMVNDPVVFKAQVNVIVSNRLTDMISDLVDKVYTRDLFGGEA